MSATVSKSSFSAQWIQARWAIIAQEVPFLEEDDRPSAEVFDQYERIFQRMNSSVEKKVNTIIVNNWIAMQNGLDSVTRMLSQARAPHVGGLNALCQWSATHGSRPGSGPWAN